MRVSPRGLALIKRFEGFSPTLYRCPAGFPTIGYGHVVQADEALVISEKEAEALLKKDVAHAAYAVEKLIHVLLRAGQFDALVSFTFNLGSARLEMSRLRRRVNAGEHEAVPVELMRWVYAGGRVLPGLVARRREEARIYME